MAFTMPGMFSQAQRRWTSYRDNESSEGGSGCRPGDGSAENYGRPYSWRGDGFSKGRHFRFIRCAITAELHYFELGEITDQSVAQCTADALKYDEPRGTAFSQAEPFAYIIGKKRTKTYTTNGAPVDLVLYYRNQSPPFAAHFSELLESSMADVEALVTSGPFQRLWIFDFAKKRSTSATSCGV
jgi:hypothetical protein